MTLTTRLLWRLRGSAVVRRVRAWGWVRGLEGFGPLRRVVARGLQQRIGGDAGAASAIERYSLFQGTLHVVGWIEAGGAVRTLTLTLPGGASRLVPFSSAGLDRIAFDTRVELVADGTEVALATLEARLVDGRLVRLHDLGAAVGDPAHALSAQFQAMLAERATGELLEVGSRARSGFVRRDLTPPGWEYSGFDIMAGANVDLVGDAHRLSRHYAAERFDAVMAFSVLEHLLMPWKFVIELNRVLKPGGIGLFTTHQCWPLHDRPWDFWRFSDTAWTALLNPATGFEIIEARMGEPAFIVAQKCSVATAFAETPAGALASFVLFRKIGGTTLDWPVELDAITSTAYPTTGAPLG